MASTACIHKTLDCGIELAILPLENRHTVAIHMRFFAGFAHESESQLGLNHVVEQTISKGTQQRTGRELSDAFDRLGVGWSSWSGREATGYHLTCLPEFTEPALELQAEFLCSPTFPDDTVDVAVQNHLQEIENLQDDPHDLSAKLFNRQVYGPVLGRHVIGEPETLRTIKAADARAHWKQFYHAGRMQVSVAGAIDARRIEDQLSSLFAGLGSSEQTGRERFAHQFEPQTTHHHRDLEQEHIGICYPGAALDDARRYAQAVAIAVLSGGMSGRLFTEIREKQGLVYWVTAHTEHPRGIGIVYLGASTKPERCLKTYQTLLHEVGRLRDDLEQSELDRAITGMVAKFETRGDITRARCNALADDLFHHGRVIPVEEKMAAVQAVTLDDVRGYLDSFPRDRLSVLTLGPKSLNL